jgi:hypothetical protein
MDRCVEEAPEFRSYPGERSAACHLVEEHYARV